MDITSCKKQARLSTQRYVKRVLPQCVHVIAICKIVRVGDDLLKTDVRFGQSWYGCNYSLRTLVGTVPILVRYGAGFPTAIVPQLMASSLAVSIETQCPGV